ncbi:MAG: hypothetical protein A2W93_09790 [Bacteroidetes bacterium GWF2_43_63]|nr:MAG: hypothetical protein A2W94_00125 [Bacteroidetes bacterium GWE2_42_42]OFY56146.1 MAG: hypothetical protein A2W93_09790 [Bacteroidetes bacterium GWF2_43_63]HCY24068.1 hypothetical protein [Bacteroidales bacterium]
MNVLKTICLTLLLFIASYASGQLEIESALTSGQNQTKPEGFLNLALCPSYEINNWTLGAGTELALLNPQNTILDVWTINAERKMIVKEHEYKLYGGFFCRPFSEYIRELNLVVEFSTENNHLRAMIGNNSRIWRLSGKALEQWPEADSAGTAIKKEWRNFLYCFSYHLKKTDHPWNIGIGFSNTNGFFFNQETMPMLFGRYENNISKSMQLYAECWLQQSGGANLQAQYYGFFVKGGLVWKSGK